MNHVQYYWLYKLEELIYPMFLQLNHLELRLQFLEFDSKLNHQYYSLPKLFVL